LILFLILLLRQDAVDSEIKAFAWVQELLSELHAIKSSKSIHEFNVYFLELFRSCMQNSGDVLGDGSYKFNEANEFEGSLLSSRQNLQKCIEGNVNEIDETGEIGASEIASDCVIKLDCFIVCNATSNKPVDVCRVCWTKANYFTKYMMEEASKKIKKSRSARPNPDFVAEFGDQTYHDISSQQTMDLFLGVNGIGQKQGII
jgi:hypothetical protein